MDEDAETFTSWECIFKFGPLNGPDTPHYPLAFSVESFEGYFHLVGGPTFDLLFSKKPWIMISFGVWVSVPALDVGGPPRPHFGSTFTALLEEYRQVLVFSFDFFVYAAIFFGA